MGTLLSIVVAAYNSEKTLERTLQSLVPLLKKGVQAVIVDDGSLDKTYEIADTFSRTVTGVEVFRLAHNGSASARNFGLSCVKSKFVMFCDADDELLEFNLDDLNETNNEVIVCSYLYEKANGAIEIVASPVDDSASKAFLFSPELAKILMNQIGFWRYIYKTDFLREQSVRFVGTLEELKADYFVLDDYFFLLHVLTTFKLGTSWGTPVYKYYENPQANYQRFRRQSKFMAIAATIQITEMAGKLSKERFSWYRSELRRQLFSSFQAVSLKDTYSTWWKFTKAVWSLHSNSSLRGYIHGFKDFLLLFFVLLRKTAVQGKSLITFKN